MKRICACLLAVWLLFVTVGCHEQTESEPSLTGSWVITSFVLEDGTQTSIENELYLTFYDGGFGETKSGTNTHNAFTFVASEGKLTRTIDYGRGEPEVVQETYTFHEDGTLTIQSPATKNAPAATMTLKRRGTQ